MKEAQEAFKTLNNGMSLFLFSGFIVKQGGGSLCVKESSQTVKRRDDFVVL